MKGLEQHEMIAFDRKRLGWNIGIIRREALRSTSRIMPTLMAFRV